MEPAVTGTAKLDRVTISSLALMKIVQHGTRSLPELCAGSLLGLDDGEGGLEVTNCFAYPAANSMSVAPPQAPAAASDAAAGAEGEEISTNQVDSDISDFRSDYMRLLRDSGSADDFSVGWYRTVNTGDWCTFDIVEQQYEHQDECDGNTGKAKSVLIVYDPYQTDSAQLSIKALRLTDSFMEMMRVRSISDPKNMTAFDAMLAQMKMSDVFYEIPIDFTPGSTLAKRALKHQFSHLAEEVKFDRLVVDPNPKLEKTLAFAMDELERLKAEVQNTVNFQKFLSKQKLQQERWMAQRKQENAQREKRGEEPLPLRDNSLLFFKTFRDGSKLNTLLARKQTEVYCEQIDEAAAQSFEKLRVVAAVQNSMKA